MGSEGEAAMPPSHLFTPSLLTILTLALLLPSIVFAKKREAGFYTTRFGRSDPSMEVAREAELESRWMPVMGRNTVPAWDLQEQQEVEEEGRREAIACVWSARAKAYLCREPAPWNRKAHAIGISS